MYNCLMDEEELRSRLADLPITALRCFDIVGSTNDEAIAWAEAGAGDLSLVIAEQQTSGRGRMGRSWYTCPGGALAFSLVVRPSEVEQAYLTLFSLAAALALCQALEDAYDLHCQVKWPNDVLINMKKVAGVLSESTWVGTQVQAVVIGMGVNVAAASHLVEQPLLFPATSIEAETGGRVDRIDVLHDLLNRFVVWRAKICQPEFQVACIARLAFLGKKVILQQGETRKSGTLDGIESDGALRLLDEDGGLSVINAGDVHLRPDEMNEKNHKGGPHV